MTWLIAPLASGLACYVLTKAGCDRLPCQLGGLLVFAAVWAVGLAP